jgi:hypothetical protein
MIASLQATASASRLRSGCSANGRSIAGSMPGGHYRQHRAAAYHQDLARGRQVAPHGDHPRLVQHRDDEDQLEGAARIAGGSISSPGRPTTPKPSPAFTMSAASSSMMYRRSSNIDDKVWEVTEGALTDENTVIIWLAFGNPTRNTGASGSASAAIATSGTRSRSTAATSRARTKPTCRRSSTPTARTATSPGSASRVSSLPPRRCSSFPRLRPGGEDSRSRAAADRSADLRAGLRPLRR